MPDPLHLANVSVHVALGTTTLVVGLVAFFLRKGGTWHVLLGRTFVAGTFGVAMTAAIGVAFFRPDATLGAVTALVCYQLFSGVRAASTASLSPLDHVVAGAGFFVGSGFLVFVSVNGSHYWRPEVTLPLAAGLLLVSGYDLIRLTFAQWRKRIRRLEHGAKMLAVIGALSSAAFGTLAPNWQPWSQIGPSLFFTIVAATYILCRGRFVLREQRRDDACESTSQN